MSIIETHGEWVTHAAWSGEGSPPWAPPTLRTVWHLRSVPQSATIHVLAVGVWEASIGGVRVGDAYLEPGVSDVGTRVASIAHDVTALLQPGANEFVLQLGEGPAHVRTAPGRYTKFEGTALAPRARVVLDLVDHDGRRRILASDGGWQARLGPTSLAHWYGGEDYDARQEPDGWLTVEGTGDDGWDPARVVGGPTDGPAPWRRRAAPVRVQETYDPVALTRHPLSFVVDFGRNLAGVAEVSVHGLASGDTVVLRPAEYLDAEGHADQFSTGTPIFDRFTSAGRPATWHPRFSYRGFRYVEVEQTTADGERVSPDPAQISLRALRMMSENRPVGRLRMSDPVLQGIDTLITHAAQSNLMTVPTDCPHREKLGWLEQLHLVFTPLAFRWDIREHWHDMITHMGDAQTPDGLIPDIAPELVVFDFDFEPGFRDDVNWGSAIWQIPALLHRHYATLEPAREAWATGMRYLDYLDATAGDGLLATGLGDWIALEENTPRPLVAAHGHARALDAASSLAGALDRHDEASRLADRAAGVRRLVRERYLGEAVAGSRGSVALLADLGVLDPAEGARLLAELLRDDDYRPGVGEIALPAMLRVLTAAGDHESIYRLAVQNAGPGYARMLDEGATALCEHWPGVQSRRSGNHFMLGVIGEWFIGSVAGLRQAPGSIGWRQAVIAPHPVGDVDEVDLDFDSPAGTFAVRWALADGVLAVSATVPDGSDARLLPPAGFTGETVLLGPGLHEHRFRRDAR